MDSEEEPTIHNESQNEQLPSVHVDYRVFSVDVYGGPGDSLEDVNEIVEERIDEAVDNIEKLKRNERELESEYEVEEESSESQGRGPSGHYQ